MPEMTDRLARRTPYRWRQRVTNSRLRIRQVTASYRALPNFLILGTQRGGTSSLYKYLEQHPQVIPSLRKEVRYFTIDYGRGLNWYRAHFPLLDRMRAQEKVLHRRMLTFEASPDYLFHPLAAERAAGVLPGVQLVVLLRDPIERAYSHYRHTVGLGFEQLSFADAIEAESERLAGGIDRIVSDPNFERRHYLRYSYLARGLYAEQLERWMCYYPRDRLLIIESESLYDTPDTTYAKILDFLQLEPRAPREFKNFSRSDHGVSREPMIAPELQVHLEAFFEPHNAHLRAITDSSFRWLT